MLYSHSIYTLLQCIVVMIMNISSKKITTLVIYNYNLIHFYKLNSDENSIAAMIIQSPHLHLYHMQNYCWSQLLAISLELINFEEAGNNSSAEC
jgi:hypothetical protein